MTQIWVLSQAETIITVVLNLYAKLSNFTKWKLLSTEQLFLPRTILNENSCHFNRKVASSRLSRLVAHPRILRLFINGKFDPYVLWLLAKKVKNWVVDRSPAHNFTVVTPKGHTTVIIVSAWLRTHNLSQFYRKIRPKLIFSEDADSLSNSM